MYDTNDSASFIGTAQHHGFSSQIARTALDSVSSRLSELGYAADAAFYVYRIGGNTTGASGGSGRPRLLLAFASADSALAFAQRNSLGATPRLLRMSIAQLLAILLQRPSIGALLFVTELAEVPPGRQLPPGFHLDRMVLLDMLQGR